MAGTGSTNDKVAVAVVSWNTRSHLRGCLDSLRPDFDAGRAEAWVVDNGSSDGSQELVEESYPWVGLIRATSNLGFGRAINEVAPRVSSPWIAVANADVELCPGALEALLAVGAARPQAAVIAPLLLLPDGSVQRSVFSFPSIVSTTLANAGIHRLRGAWARRLWLEARWDPAVEQEVDYAMGAFLLLRREAFDAVGGFNAGQWMFAEDMDLCWRLRRVGWSTVFAPTAVVRHAGGAATDLAFGRDETTALKLGALYAWLDQRRGRAVAVMFAVVNLAGALARYTLASLIRIISPSRGNSRAEAARSWLCVSWSVWRAKGLARIQRG